MQHRSRRGVDGFLECVVELRYDWVAMRQHIGNQDCRDALLTVNPL